jgi:hypothetical protein
MKKYEIYLPLKYNDGQEIEPEKLKQIRQQLIAVFGAVTVSSLAAPFEERGATQALSSSTTLSSSRSLPSRIFAQIRSLRASKNSSNERCASLISSLLCRRLRRFKPHRRQRWEIEQE